MGAFPAGVLLWAGSYTITTISVPGGSLTQVYGINDSGQIVGTYYQGNAEHAFFYSDGKYTTFGPVGLIPYGINNAGDIAGGYLGVGSLTGKFTVITPPATHFFAADAFSINNAGQVVGQLDESVGSGSFFYSGGVASILFTPTPRGINDSGEIVGWQVIGDPLTQGVQSFVSINGVTTALTIPGAFSTTASGVNDSGEIVGTYAIGSLGSDSEGFLDNDGVLISFKVPGAASTGIDGINNEGQIIGTFTNGVGPAQSYIATPLTVVPEPGVFVFLGLTLGGLSLLKTLKLARAT
jgi:probable HAF family extracellular repeat protein